MERKDIQVELPDLKTKKAFVAYLREKKERIMYCSSLLIDKDFYSCNVASIMNSDEQEWAYLKKENKKTISFQEFKEIFYPESVLIDTCLDDIALFITIPEELKTIKKILQKHKEHIYEHSTILMDGDPGSGFVFKNNNEWIFSTNSPQKSLISIDKLETILESKNTETMETIKTIKTIEKGNSVKIINLDTDSSNFFLGSTISIPSVMKKDIIIGDIVEVISVYKDYIRIKTNNGNVWSIPLSCVKLFKEDREQEFIISRDNLAKIYEIVCSEWKYKIENILSKQNFNNDITLSEEFVRKGYNEANPSQAELLEKYLPLPKKKVTKTVKGFINVYPKDVFNTHISEESAKKSAGHDALVVAVPVSFDYKVEE